MNKNKNLDKPDEWKWLVVDPLHDNHRCLLWWPENSFCWYPPKKWDIYIISIGLIISCNPFLTIDMIHKDDRFVAHFISCVVFVAINLLEWILDRKWMLGELPDKETWKISLLVTCRVLANQIAVFQKLAIHRIIISNS